MVQVSELTELNNDIYNRTRLAGLEDAPDDIAVEVEAVRQELDVINNELNRTKELIAWGNTVAIDAYAKRMERLRTRLTACTKKFLDWQAEQKARDSRPASESDIAALIAKFNKKP